jgi:ATP adenylyltransferase
MKNTNIWAPWRIGYLKSLGEEERKEKSNGCFLCNYWAEPDKDNENLVLWRTENCMVLFNRFPYTGGHMLIAPSAHVSSMDDLNNVTMLEMMHLARDGQKVLSETIHPQGFNVGINIQRCAGAGLPDHIHMHLVPRWEGDTNFMAVTGQVRVISQALDELYGQLREKAKELGLPKVK